MNVQSPSPSTQSGTPATGGHARWRVVSLIWIVAGFLFPLVTPSTTTLAAGLQPLLSSTLGISDELLAYRVTVTVVRVPLTAVFGILVAVAQCAVLPGVRPLARRWLSASAVGAAVSTLVLLPSSLILIEIAVSSSLDMRMFMALAGAALFGGFVSFFQRRAVRGRLWLPAWFVVASVLGATAGAFGTLSAFGGLR